jgi:predicted membrane protein (TIGR00267 family)
MHKEELIFKNEGHQKGGSLLRDIILGGQDGLVNVLGLVLGVASATSSFGVVLVAGLAATFAESISMAAVAFTSTKAAAEFFEKERQREIREMKELPKVETQEIRGIYRAKGFRGKDLERIVKTITSDKQMWLDIMMAEELKLEKPSGSAGKSALVVGLSSLCGSVIPLLPFFLFPVKTAIVATIIWCAIMLFIAGVLKSKFTVVGWKRSGLELAAIGTVSALVGYAIGTLLGTGPV